MEVNGLKLSSLRSFTSQTLIPANCKHTLPPLQPLLTHIDSIDTLTHTLFNKERILRTEE